MDSIKEQLKLERDIQALTDKRDELRLEVKRLRNVRYYYERKKSISKEEQSKIIETTKLLEIERKERQKKINSKVIKACKQGVAEAFNMSVDMLSFDTNKQIIVMARNCYYEAVKSRLDNRVSLEEIGDEVGRIHSSVIHGLKTFKNDYKANENYKINCDLANRKIDELLEEIK